MIDEKFLEEIIDYDINEDEINDFYHQIKDMLNEVVDDIYSQNHLVNSEKVNYIVFNDYLSLTYTENSVLDLILSIDSPILERNTVVNDKFSIKENLKDLFSEMGNLRKERKAERKLKKKKYKEYLEYKQKLEEASLDKNALVNHNKPFGMEEFRNQFANKLLQKLTEDYIVELNKFTLKIYAKDKLGVDINLYFAFYDEENDYQKLYNFNDKDYLKFNPFYNIVSLTEKEMNTDGISTQLIRILKKASFDIFGSFKYDRFIESLVCSLPNRILIHNTSYQSMIKKVITYITNNDIENYISVCSDKKIFEDELINVNPYHVRTFIKEIEKYFL